MINLLSSAKLSEDGIAIVRIILGSLLVIHGCQMFNTNEMAAYGPRLANLGMPFPHVTAYAGKVVELTGGACLVLGMFTRLACFFLMCTFLLITIVMGGGKIFTDAQHPFLFFLFSLLFFFTGAGKWSLSRNGARNLID